MAANVTVPIVMGEVHGRKYGTKHKTKCGKWNGQLPAGDREVAHKDIDKITCELCKRKHVLGKC